MYYLHICISIFLYCSTSKAIIKNKKNIFSNYQSIIHSCRLAIVELSKFMSSSIFSSLLFDNVYISKALFNTDVNVHNKQNLYLSNKSKDIYIFLQNYNNSSNHHTLIHNRFKISSYTFFCKP